MSQEILSGMGFNMVNIKDNAQPQSEKVKMDVSVIKPDDHKHPQIVFKLPRTILTMLDWEISDRVKIMAKPDSKSIAIVKAGIEDNNTFAISSQGTSVENARQQKRGGVVKVGWRNQLGESPEVLGTHNADSHVLQAALIVQLPQTMFA